MSKLIVDTASDIFDVKDLELTVEQIMFGENQIEFTNTYYDIVSAALQAQGIYEHE
jgi:hypothetical protein